MFRIRRIHDDALPVNREAILQVKAILAEQFADAPKRDIDSLSQNRYNANIQLANQAAAVTQPNKLTGHTFPLRRIAG